jgi:glycosyltransferase involved in cell wall biosynthesis
MRSALLLSIIINNYNYARYLGDAIRSALDQTYAITEVIVVDDGSTDSSDSVIAQFDDRVRAIFQSNGGQASAMNTGFAACSGDVVIFLDSDDTLDPDIGEKVVSAFLAEPELVKVQYRLRVVDGDGKSTPYLAPPHWQPLPSGDLRRRVSRHYTYNYPPTSGNAFAASALRSVFPIPEHIYRINGDQYLHDTVVLLGPIRSLDRSGGSYRIHTSNQIGKDGPVPSAFRLEMRLNYEGFPYIRAIADSAGLADFPRRYDDLRDRRILTHRIVSLKSDPDRHPIPGDRLFELFWKACVAAARYPDVPVYRKAAYCLSILALICAPRPLARWFAVQRARLTFPDISNPDRKTANGVVRRLLEWAMPRPAPSEAIPPAGQAPAISRHSNEP